ncbi:hypothetical protein OHA72_48705 [Dactylosporangium sp. NBC_01737]|uniref:hypothetical protein n=1 Tax=Dactylosporangium sp. NBC_01737 TaxID=2975959 RepID=UPI002E132CD2|nr:hypothetical protein OHA72_48705 [Dactylosporangium sp. NBC_01737]
MSYTFVTAARIVMPREGFESWLDAPVASGTVIENPAEMFAGWYWGDREGEADWSDAETGQTARQLLAERVASPEAMTVLRYRNGALEAYLWTVGYSGFWETPARQLLLMLAGAGAFKADDTEDYVLFWEDAGGMLPERNEDALLALLAAGRRRVRFAGKRPLADILGRLKPVEEAFHELAEALDDDDPQPSAVLLDPTYIDPAVLNPVR